MSNFKYFTLFALLIILFTGCYTQFITVEDISSLNNLAKSVDTTSTDSSVSKVPLKDTVYIRDNETCYWQRDFWGQPVLRCYKSYFNSDWHTYYDLPWWYDYGIGYNNLNCDCSRFIYGNYYNHECYSCNEYCYWYCKNRQHYNYYNSNTNSTNSSVNIPKKVIHRRSLNVNRTQTVPTGVRKNKYLTPNDYNTGLMKRDYQLNSDESSKKTSSTKIDSDLEKSDSRIKSDTTISTTPTVKKLRIRRRSL